MNSQNRRYFHTLTVYLQKLPSKFLRIFPSNLYVKLDPPPKSLPYSDPPLIFNGVKRLKQAYDMSMTFDIDANGTEFI